MGWDISTISTFFPSRTFTPDQTRRQFYHHHFVFSLCDCVRPDQSSSEQRWGIGLSASTFSGVACSSDQQFMRLVIISFLEGEWPAPPPLPFFSIGIPLPDDDPRLVLTVCACRHPGPPPRPHHSPACTGYPFSQFSMRGFHRTPAVQYRPFLPPCTGEHRTMDTLFRPSSIPGRSGHSSAAAGYIFTSLPFRKRDVLPSWPVPDEPLMTATGLAT